MLRKHRCGYEYLYRDTHARELVEFIERVVPEGGETFVFSGVYEKVVDTGGGFLCFC